MNENQVSNQENNTTLNPSNINVVNDQQTSISNSESISPAIDSTSVPPIEEVKVEASSDAIISGENSNQEVSISPVSSSGDSGQPSTQPPKNSKTSTILLVLLFVFLFAFIMGMPYINDFIHQLKSDTGLSEIEKQAKEEEEKQKQEEASKNQTSTSEEEQTKELICTSSSTTVGNYTLVDTQTFYYNSKNQILTSKVVSSYDFTIEDIDYTSLKQQCDEDSLKYLTHEGYTMACSYGEGKIEISHEFDLETFTPIVDGTTNIQANATYQQDLSTIKTNLISQGYTCQ